AGHGTSIHLETFPEPDPAFAGSEASERVEQLLRLRDMAQTAIDTAVKSNQFKKREQAAVVFHLPADDPARAVLDAQPEEALEFLMVSTVSLADAGEASASVQVTVHEECPRCRRSIALVPDGELCARCAEVVEAMSIARP